MKLLGAIKNVLEKNTFPENETFGGHRPPPPTLQFRNSDSPEITFSCSNWNTIICVIRPRLPRSSPFFMEKNLICNQKRSIKCYKYKTEQRTKQAMGRGLRCETDQVKIVALARNPTEQEKFHAHMKRIAPGAPIFEVAEHVENRKIKHTPSSSERVPCSFW